VRRTGPVRSLLRGEGERDVNDHVLLAADEPSIAASCPYDRKRASHVGRMYAEKGAEISMRVGTYAANLFHQMTVTGMTEPDLSDIPVIDGNPCRRGRCRSRCVRWDTDTQALATVGVGAGSTVAGST
jgi:hypothetical protein